jgi:hypothetical protein
MLRALELSMGRLSSAEASEGLALRRLLEGSAADAVLGNCFDSPCDGNAFAGTIFAPKSNIAAIERALLLLRDFIQKKFSYHVTTHLQLVGLAIAMLVLGI